jgi:S-adenosylmethionine uptake transporter
VGAALLRGKPVNYIDRIDFAMSAVPAGAAPAAPPAPTRRSALWPLACAALGAAAFVSMDATVKSLAARYGAVQLTFFRFAAGLGFALLLWAWVRSPMPARAQWRLHALRCILLLLSLTSYFHALTLLPLAQAVAMSYTAPLFISLLAMLALGERPSRWIWLSLALGLAGAGVALWPELQRADHLRLEGLAAAAFASVAFSGVMVLARHQAQRDSLWTILLLQNLLPALLLAGPAAAGWQPIDARDLPAIVLTGALATVGLLAITWAFKHLEASRVAPMEYTGLVWAGLLGYLLFGEVPTPHTLASAALIVGGCLLLLRR